MAKGGVTLTNGILNALIPKKGKKCDCSKCGFGIPVYPGRYPKCCPMCSWPISGWIAGARPKEKEETPTTTEPPPANGGSSNGSGSGDTSMNGTSGGSSTPQTGGGGVSESVLTEKWNKPTRVSKAEKGKYAGRSVKSLQAEYSQLRSKGSHKKGSKEFGKMKELGFAIRAKTGWGGLGLKESIGEAVVGIIDGADPGEWAEYLMLEGVPLASDGANAMTADDADIMMGQGSQGMVADRMKKQGNVRAWPEEVFPPNRTRDGVTPRA